MNRPIRSLLAWFEQDEAVNILFGSVPQQGVDVAAQIAQWTEKRAALFARAPYQAVPVQIEPLPPALTQRGADFAARADVQGMLAGLQWQLGLVDLSTLLSYQKLVVLEQAQERVAGLTQNDWEGLFSVCLPDATAPTQMPVMFDPDGKGLTLSSLNPNLRVIGHVIQSTDVDQGAGGVMKATVLGFLVKQGASFVQVVEYNGRWFVRDGYHRCYGLLTNGITRVPCIVIHAANFPQTGAALPAFFSYEILFGAHPPRLVDFSDDAVSIAAQQRATRKVVRVMAQEFVVEI